MTSKHETLSNETLIGSANAFQTFLDTFRTAEFRQKLVANSDLSDAQVKQKLDTYLSEMMHGYHFVAERLPQGKLRILEVGAGLGLLSIYLHKLGHDVVALEPSGLAFGFFNTTKQEVWKVAGSDIPILNENLAEKLTPAKDGTFDFIFSVNVMEHIKEIKAATAAIIMVLKPNGVCVNSCPNYLVPYEPHYAIPMVPFIHSLTRRIFDKKITSEPDIWDSLNFINWFTVRQMARENSASVTFETALIYKAFLRLDEDTEFMARHKDGLAAKLYKLLKATRTLNLLKFAPAPMSTPMIFTYRKNS